MEGLIMTDDFKPRDYQISIMEIAIKQNTIIFLPTGSGKTLIAVMILKRLSKPLQKPLSQGGKLSIMLVNTVALVDQQAKYLRTLTNQDVGAYSGEMNVDSWNREMWHKEFETHQILIMTAQILVNLLAPAFLTLNQVNLLIFDECHNAVNDHAMRQVMSYYNDLDEEPRIIGLSATLLNKNCKPDQVIDEVTALETTFHSKIATVEDLEKVIGYSTNPNEVIRPYKRYTLNLIDQYSIIHLESLIKVLTQVKTQQKLSPPLNSHLKPLDVSTEFKDAICLIKDVIYHITEFGSYVGELAVIAHTIQLERIKKNCQDPKVATIYDAVMTGFTTVKKMFTDHMSESNPLERIYRYSSNQIITLFQILEQYDQTSKQSLCGIIFVQRRFTAKLIYNVLKNLKNADPTFAHVEPNFVVGFNTNPFNDTREGFYRAKMNKKILQQFYNKEINLLVASNVLEEGVDIPTCSLVVNFNQVTNYRGYIQSKGRARHKDSFYYMIVDDFEKFSSKYITFQDVEATLNRYLVGTNEARTGPDLEFCDENEIPPYYVNGKGSAKVDLLSAISLLCRYCLKLPSDKYTTYTPNWYLETHDTHYRVVIELPTVSNILEPIQGPFMSTKKQAKRAAALKACEILHKRGELDDLLLPIKTEDVNENLSYYFSHWPKIKERNAGGIKKRRVHSKQIPIVCTGKILSNANVYLHLIEFTPLFSTHSNISMNMIHQLYQSELRFGFISAQFLPKLCKFSVFVTAGEILVNLKLNYKTIVLTTEQLESLKRFHCLIFADILKVLKSFLVIDNDGEVDGFLVVPIRKKNDFCDIDFDVSYTHKEVIDEKLEPSYEERKRLEVNKESYLGKIVTPWYRRDEQVYLVTNVCTDLNAYSQFPSDEFQTYRSYYKEKYDKDLVNGGQPLLLVKGLSKRLNCLKPRLIGNKRSREKVYEDVEEHLIPELCVKQEIPAALWIQAMLLPSVLYRLLSLIQAEELRSIIALESGMGLRFLPEQEEWSPLVFDKHVMTYENNEIPKVNNPEGVSDELTEVDFKLPMIEMIGLCQDFATKKLNDEYSWDIEEEPIDIERNLNVTLMDVQYFENFISQPLAYSDRIRKNHLVRTALPAITYDVSYVYKDIKLLNPRENQRGPELVDVYTALTTAKNNDVINLERMETLGDSFLKLSVSLFVILRYPNFDEGRLTTFKGQLISNKNLYYIGKKKNIPGYLRLSDFTRGLEWKPPSFCVPKLLVNRINKKEISVHSLFYFMFSKEEQGSGVLSQASSTKILDMENDMEDQEEVECDSTLSFLDQQMVPDKTVADGVEALLGVYFQSYGFKGGLNLLKWLEIIPASENIDQLLNMELPNPVLDRNDPSVHIDYHLPSWQKIETTLGYTFKNKAYLLQALTHSSYTPNRKTNCYQTLEFLGDAVLDFLITCHIYETCENLTPGDLTDLRSALVNNITFAGFTVRCGFQKHLLFSNNKLLNYIDNFVQHQESKNYAINEEVSILLQENDLFLAEHIDVPKVLGDTFEALAGAIFLDSGMCLETVWKIFHRIMWKEIESFKTNVPKNAVRLIHETVGAHPEFDKSVTLDTGETMVGLKFMLNGAKKKVYGFGENKSLAKKAAAKIALRLLYKH
ncbi:hypothetical protein RN001_006658 [Aquatica leii]|uniref:ribonuclease III n=1 Tax=Aquatica leii TaxID=1421715 RepID=A0AAN7Q1Z8_9COLE|nr:hypothetical protein RN001_006658 [Aquatica leii]